MRKSFLLVLFAFSLLTLNAQDFTYGDLEYTIDDDDVTVTVTGHIDGYEATGTLNIPTLAYYNGNAYTVTIIDSYAFYHCDGLSGTLVLPNTIEEIGDDAFDYCGFTGVVNIPASVEDFGYTPFYGCDGIEGFVVDPNNGDYDSRDNCNAIIRTYSNTLEIGCKNSTIPNTVVSIEEDAFNHVRGLTSITVESGNAVYDSRNDCNAIVKTSANELISGCQNTVIPDAVIRIGDNAFYYCSTLTGELVILEQITSIGKYAFEKCTGLTGSLVIPNTVVELGESAFGNCTGFDGTLTLSENLTYIGSWTFEECAGFTGSLVIPNTVTSIGSSAFEGCHGFDGTLTLSKGLTSVESFAFASCDGFMDAVIYAEVPPTLGEYPFGGFGSAMLTVPCGCIPAYENTAWYDQFTTIYQDCEAVSENQPQTTRVYPNPTQGQVTIEAESIHHVSIYNLLGEKVLESAASGDDYEVDLGGMEKGLYLIRIETKKEILTEFVTVM